MKIIAATCFILVVVVFVQWRELKRVSRLSKTINFLLLALSGVIWIYLMTAPQVFYPSIWLHKQLDPLVPFTNEKEDYLHGENF